MKLSTFSSAVQVMGVLNVTPDSFYPRSRYSNLDQALQAVEQMVEEGADLIDLGAESSRPGAESLEAEEEIQRLLPVLKEVVRRYTIPVSVDTWKSEVAERALGEGASCINDITGLTGSPEMAATIARNQGTVILMHMRGRPATMQKNLEYEDLFGELRNFFEEAIGRALDAGIRKEQIALDPGIGFGKGVQDNLRLIRGLHRFQDLGYPLVLGVSRKSFIGKILDLPVDSRLEGSLACGLIGIQNGARILRVHDVAATRRMVDMFQAIQDSETSQ